MRNKYEGVLQFKGQWRNYQERILANASGYLADKKIHIVAAPGSGKTTLGIELIRRLGESCLIFSPSITIRQQWLERITEGFLVKGHKPEEILSNDLRHMKSITAVTYQALYSAMKHYQGELKEESETWEETKEGEAEQVDFRDFDLFGAVKEAKVKTICLDEAHHLRSEWWKALEKFIKELPDVTVVALTATPPYDSTPGQWKRYIDLCGPIDEEIFTPELVREGTLCPHEDYVFFNWPSKEEEAEIKNYQKRMDEVWGQLLNGEDFTRMIASHKGLASPEEYREKFLENPRYFSALLIFCQARRIPLAPYLRELIGTKGRLPKLDAEWLETLLQGFLFEDTESYQVTEEKRQQIVKELKEAGCIYRKKVSLTHREALRKLLVKSQGKMESIRRIVEAEHQTLGDELRLLILCDYIKKDRLPLVGTDRKLRAEIGAVPIFEYLRRKEYEGIRLGCLSGSVVLVPLDTEKKLKRILKEKNCEAGLTPIKDTGYGQLQVKGKNTHVVAAVTELFRQGAINTLVGTKSLLGEGWDAPCVNSLILATYVGSFMLSNQMRGRTIRTDGEHPEKTGNIWHLACIFPQKSGRTKHADLSGDYETLERRFDTFLGVSWQTDTIESGIGRLGIPPFDSRERMEEINGMMLERARDREGLRRRWETSLREIRGEMEIRQMEAVPREEVKTGYVFINALIAESLSAAITILMNVGRYLLVSGQGASSFWAKLLTVGSIAACLCLARYGILLFKFSTPQRRMKQIGQAVAEALAEIGELEDPGRCRAEVKSAEGMLIGIWLKGGTTRDKTAFASCMEEIWGIIDNPRYLLTRSGRGPGGSEYYSVPEVFGRQKDRALIFEKHMRKALGKYRLVYTRTPEGRKILLKARTRSFVNKNQQALLGRKVAKGKYE
ncbi:MAG: DEAD/DEAH box helicase family protein [Ruminococcus sp.]